MTLKFPVELIINGDEWKIQPFRFNVHAINTGSYTPSYRDVTVTGVSPLNLPNAQANGLKTIKLFGKCEQTPNLFDKDKATLNYFINASGEEQYNASWACTDYIEVTAGKPYNLSGVTSYGSSPRTGFYAADKSFVSARSQSSADFTIPDGVKYMRMSIYKTSIDTAVIKQVLSIDNPIPILCNNGEVGSTGYTVVGSPTISSDLVVSGFSANDCLNIGNYFSYTNLNGHDWKIECEFTYNAVDTSTTQAIMQIFNRLAHNSIRLYNNKVWCSLLTTAYTEKTLSPVLVNSKTYKVALECDKSTKKYTLSLYQDNTLLDSVDTFTTGDLTFAVNFLNKFFIGRGTDNTSWYPRSSVDLKKFNIIVDGVPVRLPETVKILGKNIFDQSQILKATDWTLTDGWYTGLFSNFNTQFTNGFEIDVPFKEKTVYTFNCRGYVSDEGARARFIFVYTDESTKSLTIDGTSPAEYTLTTPSTKTLAKIRGSYASGAGSTLYLKDIQLEEGSSATAFQSYHASPTAVARDLLSCGDDYVDEQNITTGEITRKVGYYIFDGTENWRKSASQPSSGIRFQANTGLANRAYGANLSGLCTHFNTVASSAIQQDINTFVYSTFNEYIFVIVDSNNFPTVDDWTSYVASLYAQGKPIIITYPLATPTTETVAAQNTLQNIEGLNTLYITQSAIDGLSMEVTYSAGVEVTIEEVQAANVDQQVEVTIGE